MYPFHYICIRHFSNKDLERAWKPSQFSANGQKNVKCQLGEVGEASPLFNRGTPFRLVLPLPSSYPTLSHSKTSCLHPCSFSHIPDSKIGLPLLAPWDKSCLALLPPNGGSVLLVRVLAKSDCMASFPLWSAFFVGLVLWIAVFSNCSTEYV